MDFVYTYYDLKVVHLLETNPSIFPQFILFLHAGRICHCGHLTWLNMMHLFIKRCQTCGCIYDFCAAM